MDSKQMEVIKSDMHNVAKNTPLTIKLLNCICQGRMAGIADHLFDWCAIATVAITVPVNVQLFWMVVVEMIIRYFVSTRFRKFRIFSFDTS